jgi:hypothetical protein
VLALCAAALVTAHLLGQDTGGGGQDTGNGAAGPGVASPDNSGLTNGVSNPDNTTPSTGAGTTGGENTNGGTTPNPNGGTGTEGNGGSGGNGTPQGNGQLVPPVVPTPAPGGASSIEPPSAPNALPPGAIAPVPGTTPAPTPPASAAPGTTGGTQAAPVTFTLPGGYGGASASQSFTLGEGRLSKPPFTFTVSTSEGYDDNLFSAPSHVQATPTPIPAPTPPLEARLVGFRYLPPTITPIYEFFRPKAAATPKPAGTLGVLGSAESTATLGIQIQKGTPRTVVIADASAGADYYYSRPGEKQDYTANMDMEIIERLTPRATFTFDMFAVYQNTPNFALINAPTQNGNGGNYINGNLKADLTYAWGARLSTVTSYNLNVSLLNTSASQNLYDHTYGTQFRFTVSPRTTLTAEWRQSIGIYPSNAASDTISSFYLLGLDLFFSSQLRNTLSAGIESHEFESSGASELLPYFEDDTILALPRGGNAAWTNSYGSQESASPTQTITSYRTGLSYSQPLSTKLVASISIAYNLLDTKDSAAMGSSYRQKQFQASASLGYTISPRLSMSLSYTYLDFLTSQINSSYTRDQVFLGGSYLFR